MSRDEKLRQNHLTENKCAEGVLPQDWVLGTSCGTGLAPLCHALLVAPLSGAALEGTLLQPRPGEGSKLLATDTIFLGKWTKETSP